MDRLNNASTPGTQLPCCTCVFSCLAPVANEDRGLWKKIFNGRAKTVKAQATNQITWENNNSSIFKAEAIKVYKTYSRRFWNHRKVKSLIVRFESQLGQPNGSTDIADYFLKERGGKACLFVMAVTPFLFDTSQDHVTGVYHFPEVYPSSQTNLKDYLHLLQAFLTATAQTSRVCTLSTQRWIVSALLHTTLI